MKTYLKNLTTEEIIKRLKNGEVVKVENDKNYYKMTDGIICCYCSDGDVIVDSSIFKNQGNKYFETEEPFKIKETGLYKTRDGKRAFVSYINEDVKYCIIGIVEGKNVFLTWTINGSYHIGEENPEDIVSKWED